MDKAKDAFFATFPWWMFAQEEDKHPGHMGAVGHIEITAAGDAELFVFLRTARKGGWSELGAACYTSEKGAGNCILLLLAESEIDEYLPPFAYQSGVIRQYLPDRAFNSPELLADAILKAYREHTNERSSTSNIAT